MSIISEIRTDDFASKIVYIVYKYTIPPKEERIVREILNISRIGGRCVPSEIAIPIANYTWATCKVALLLRYEVTVFLNGRRSKSVI